MNLTDLGLPIPSSNASGLIISKQFYVPSLTAGATYWLDSSAVFGYTVTGVYGFYTSSGSVSSTAIKVNNVSIPGLDSMTTSTHSYSASGTGNVVNIGDVLTVVFGSSSSPADIRFTLAATRT